MKKSKMTIVNDVFRGKQFVLDFAVNAHPKSKTNLREKITKHKGIISYIITKNCDYVVCTTTQSTDEFVSFKAATANKHNIPVVKEDFIDKCIETGCLLDCDDYLWTGKGNKEDMSRTGLEKGKIHSSSFTDSQKSNKAKNEKVKIWNYKDENGPDFHDRPHHIIKAVLFTGKTKTQGCPFALLELHAQYGNENSDLYRFCVFLHQGHLPSISCSAVGDIRLNRSTDWGTKQCRYFHASDAALNAYIKLWKQFTNPPNSMKKENRLPDISPFHLGSDRLRSDEWFKCTVPTDTPTRHFVNLIWDETEKKIEEEFGRDWKEISAEKIEKAAGYLLDIDKSSRDLSSEYFAEINRFGGVSLTNEPEKILQECNSLQLIRDRLNLTELTSSKNSEYELKYRALRCEIEHLQSGSDDYVTIQNLISEPNVIIKNAYRVNRPEEEENYKNKVGNEAMLFHGTSYSNIVSILSRGLLLPRIISEDVGLNLGLGLYFGNNIKGLLKFATPSEISGSRLLLVHRVALGVSYKTYEKMRHLKKPPQGFDSVHGARAEQNKGFESCFDEDEYVIYDEKQQKICYVVEFQLEDDEIQITDESLSSDVCAESHESIHCDEEEESVMSIVDIDDILHSKKEIRKKVGLQTVGGKNRVALKNVSIHGQVYDLAAQVVVLQEYVNNSSSTIEAKYFFPVDEMAAVCEFEAYLNGRHVIGRVDEKQKAKKDYDRAVSRGKSALLMDQESPDLFSIRVGNIQPKSTVLIKITYVTELDLEGDAISFRLPAAIGSPPNESSDVNVSNLKTSLELSLEMPYEIRSITSSTHDVNVKKTDTMATVRMRENQQFDERGFRLLIKLSEIHCPRMWTEEDEEKGTQACMLSFYPEFESDDTHGIDTQIVLVLDASNSMEKSFANAQKLAVLCLHNLPSDCSFNVASFGSTYEELFPDCLPFSLELIQEAKCFVSKLRPNRGDSFAKSIFRSNFLLGSSSKVIRNILFVSDGHLNDNCQGLLESVRSNCVKNGSTRIFTLAVGQAPNRHLMKNLAKVGAGDFETFDDDTPASNWSDKVEGLVNKVKMPVLTDILIEWQIFDENRKCTLIQAPRNVMTLFNGSRLIVYGILTNASTSMAVLKARVPGGREMSTIVSPYESSKSRGKIIHRLAVRSLVRDWESGALDADRTEHESVKRNLNSTLVELGKLYSIVTPFTSFIAIDENDGSSEEKLKISFPELVRLVSVDKLGYLDYDDKPAAFEKVFAMDVVDSVQPKTFDGTASKLIQTRSLSQRSFSPQLHHLRQHFVQSPSGFNIPQPEPMNLAKSFAFGAAQPPAPAFKFGCPQQPFSDTATTFGGFQPPPNKTRSTNFAFGAAQTPAPAFSAAFPAQRTQSDSASDFDSSDSAHFGSTQSSAPKFKFGYPPLAAVETHSGEEPPPPPQAKLGRGFRMSSPAMCSPVVSAPQLPPPQRQSNFMCAPRALPGTSSGFSAYALHSDKAPAFSVDTTTDVTMEDQSEFNEERPDLDELLSQTVIKGSGPIELSGNIYDTLDTCKLEGAEFDDETSDESRSKSNSEDSTSEDSTDRDLECCFFQNVEEEGKSIGLKKGKRRARTEVEDIIRENCEKVLSRNTKLSDLCDKADALSQEAEQCEEWSVKKFMKKKLIKTTSIPTDGKIVWVSLDDGCINYGGGLPFFSILFKCTALKPISKVDRKYLIPDSSNLEKMEISFRELPSIYKLAVPGEEIREWNQKLWDDIKRQLDEKGLQSLPNKNKGATYAIIAMISFAFKLLHHICPSIFPLRLNDLQIIKESADKVLPALGRTDMKIPLMAITVLNEICPMTYRALQIGECWEEAYQRLSNGESLII